VEKIEHSLEGVYLEVKPIVHAYVFELKQQWKKFVSFSVLSILIIFLMSYVMYAVVPSSLLPDTQTEYLTTGLTFLSMFIIVFASCFFFSGIICSEFDRKTGYIIFPKINKFKLIIGKYLGNLTLIIGVVIVYYVTLGLFCWYYYGVSVNLLFLASFAIAIVYILAVSSFVTLFSSFMKTVNMTIISTIMILFIGFQVADQLVTMFLPQFEPIYSMQYASNLIGSILEQPFPVERYAELSMMGPFGPDDFSFKTWITPTFETGITVLIIYMSICLILASIIFKRRQL